MNKEQHNALNKERRRVIIIPSGEFQGATSKRLGILLPFSSSQKLNPNV
jgi:hypothetical protein